MIDSKKWQWAMQSKMTALHKNQTQNLVKFLNGKKDFPCKWVYRYKLTPPNGEHKYEAQLVAKGFKQEQGIDFDEVFLPDVKMTTLRCVLALVAKHDLILHQMNVKASFLLIEICMRRFLCNGQKHILRKAKNNCYVN